MTPDHEFAEVEFDLSLPLLAPPLVENSRPLTPRQRERLVTVLRATLQLIDAKGYDAFGMRDLVGTGVATATVYRFFGSREFLVQRATSAWFDWAAQRSLPSRGSGDFRSNSIQQFESLTNMWSEHPNVIEAWMRSATSDDPLVQRFQRQSRSSVLSSPDWASTEEFEPEYADRLRQMIEVHAIGGLMQLVHGGRTIEELRAEFTSLLSLVFEPPVFRLTDPPM